MSATSRTYTTYLNVRAGMKSKVALFGPDHWALGSINSFLQKHIGNEGYEVRRFDWSSSDQIWKGFEWCDVFIAEVHFYERWGKNIDRKYAEKGLYVWHHLADIPVIPLKGEKTRHFTTNIPVDYSLKNNWYAITDTIKKSVDEFYGLDVGLLPVGTDPDFWHQRDIKSIKKIGHVSSPEQNFEEYHKVKRFDMFKEIASKSGIEGDRIFGKGILTGSYIYKGFDAVVNTSTHEGLPTPLLECAAAKIPFISTKVGIVPNHPSEELNSDPAILKKYVDDVYDDVVSKNSYESHVKNHYAPAIESVVSQNKKKQPPCYIVLGMHRSSTSMLAGSLYNSGEVHMGKLLVPGFAGNEEGHWENYDVVCLHLDMFKELGCDWMNPPTYEQLLEIAPKYEDRMKKIIEGAIADMEEAGFRSWGFKDPRTCITLPLWLKFIDTPRIIAMKRSDEEVALSLHKRNGMTMDEGMKLAKFYNDYIDSYDIWSGGID